MEIISYCQGKEKGAGKCGELEGEGEVLMN